MRLVLLGTTGYHPNENGHTPCMLLPEAGVMFDAGTAMFRAPRLLATPTLDIFLSHAHLDHAIGLTYLFSVIHQHPLERVRVFGEAEKLAAIEEHLFSEFLFPARPPMEFCPVEAGEAVPLAGGGRMTHFPLAHVGGTIGFRADWPGHSMAYVTDTTADARAAYVEQIRGADLLVHECYFPDGWEQWAAKTGHSCVTRWRRWPGRRESAGWCSSTSTRWRPATTRRAGRRPSGVSRNRVGNGHDGDRVLTTRGRVVQSGQPELPRPVARGRAPDDSTQSKRQRRPTPANRPVSRRIRSECNGGVILANDVRPERGQLAVESLVAALQVV